MARHGSRCEAIKRAKVKTVRYRNIVDETISSEKFVAGAMMEMRPSWTELKSAMLFWRSRMLRKKSLEVSEAGLMVGGGARAGPEYEYAYGMVREAVDVDGGAGCRDT